MQDLSAMASSQSEVVRGSRVRVARGKRFTEFGAGDLGKVLRVDRDKGICEVLFDGHTQTLDVALRHLELEGGGALRVRTQSRARSQPPPTSSSFSPLQPPTTNSVANAVNDWLTDASENGQPKHENGVVPLTDGKFSTMAARQPLLESERPRYTTNARSITTGESADNLAEAVQMSASATATMTASALAEVVSMQLAIDELRASIRRESEQRVASVHSLEARIELLRSESERPWRNPNFQSEQQSARIDRFATDLKRIEELSNDMQQRLESVESNVTMESMFEIKLEKIAEELQSRFLLLVEGLATQHRIQAETVAQLDSQIQQMKDQQKKSFDAITSSAERINMGIASVERDTSTCNPRLFSESRSLTSGILPVSANNRDSQPSTSVGVTAGSPGQSHAEVFQFPSGSRSLVSVDSVFQQSTWPTTPQVSTVDAISTGAFASIKNDKGDASVKNYLLDAGLTLAAETFADAHNMHAATEPVARIADLPSSRPTASTISSAPPALWPISPVGVDSQTSPRSTVRTCGTVFEPDRRRPGVSSFAPSTTSSAVPSLTTMLAEPSRFGTGVSSTRFGPVARNATNQLVVRILARLINSLWWLSAGLHPRQKPDLQPTHNWLATDRLADQ